MLWSPAKTDWEIKPYVNGIYQGDWFNVADYIRIATNIRFLHHYGQIIYGVTFSITYMPDVILNNFVRPAEINLLESNIYTLAHDLYLPPTYTGKTTWAGNGATPDADDFNRMERALLDIYNDMSSLAIYARFVPTDADSFITADGYVFNVRIPPFLAQEDWRYIDEAADVFADYGAIADAATTTTTDWGRIT